MKAGDKIEYKILSNVTKREFRKEKKRFSWESFITQMDNNLYKAKLNPYTILKHFKKGIREAADIKSPLNKYLCL
jgi:hypothetical protein